MFPPVLRVKSREGYLPENAPVGTTVRISPSMRAESLQILVEDQDLKPGMMPAIYQYVINGFGAEKFAVDQRGFLYLNSEGLDADSNSSSFQLHIQAREVDTEPLRSSDPISLTIHVMDVNDNSPYFEQPVYFANVSADDAIERFVAKVKATDLDSGRFGRLTYKIVEVSDGAERNFKYDAQNNVLSAIGRLSSGHRYRITIEAQDGGGLTGRTTVLVLALPSTTQAFTPPISAQIPQSILSMNQPGNHGSSQSQPSVPKFPQKQLLEPTNPVTPLLPLTAFTLAPETTLKPVSSQVQTILTELNEATPPHSIVAVLGDNDSRQYVYFTIVEGNEAGKFTIDQSTGAVTTTQEFDREEVDLYTLQIEARSKHPDQSLYWTLLQVIITDANDNAPEFEGTQPFVFQLKLNEMTGFPSNMEVGRVKATDIDKDDNGKVSYRVVPPKDKLFKIDSRGIIRINGELTSEHFGESEIVIVAADHGNPPLETSAKVKVIVDGLSSSAKSSEVYNTSPTFFSRATLPPSFATQSPMTKLISQIHSVMPAIESGFMLTKATLPSTIPVTTTTARTTTRRLTTTVKSTTLTTTKTPVRKQPASPSTTATKTSSVPTVVATRARPSSKPQPTPPPRLAPIFSTPTLSVMVEENDSDLELATIEAHYPDEQPGPITYVMIEGDSDIFSISSYTGKLTLLKALDAESDQEYRLVISTQEAQSMPMDPLLAHAVAITVKVLDVNDWIPNFETNNYAFTIADNTEPGTVIGQVTAFDQDRDEPNNRIHYRMVKDHDANGFISVNAQSGLITLNKPAKELSGKKITVVVEAQDEGELPQSTQTNVVITVEESRTEVIPQVEGNTKPKPDAVQFTQRNFTASLMESVRAPHFVMLLPVINKPKDTRFVMCAIVSGNYRQAFSISPGTDGNCELRTQSALDRETIEKYLLNITITAGLQTDYTLVSITVLDVNDNAPSFIFPSDLSLKAYFAGVPSNSAAFSRVINVKAEDPDLGPAGLVQYELDPSSVNSKYFQIDRDSGEIILKQSMIQLTQNNKKSSFDFKVLACDSPQTGERLCSSADVYVTAISDQHRFGITLKGSQPQQVRAHEQDIIKALRQFTGACTLLSMEKMTEKTEGKDNVINLYWYAQNPTTHKICRKQEFRKLFEKSSEDLLAGKLQPWFSMSSLNDNVAADSGKAPGLMSQFFATMDWNNFTIVCFVLTFGVLVLVMILICAFCFYKQKKKHRRHVHTYPNVYPLPKYSTAMFMNTMERDKYETQILEMPMSDEDFATLKQSSLHSEPRLANAHYRPGNNVYRPGQNHLYARSNVSKFHDDGDFSVEENMYAIHTPSRFDPQRIPSNLIPMPDYNQSFSNHKKSLL
ncbi:unnamed protein product [Bursaphelenchus xylophilus]|uniref:(pine wood nematode) hypothetical protein n=1 Tax=Bursaphelenchus xylophilus TaxID=6326 RepID=A0A1I7RHC2_BURXY|nr:unnamed protein product [Bursaphelenchus xylophilus]CAG9115856.1 unnamed protein product [Bursaphelenchus xylophilus]